MTGRFPGASDQDTFWENLCRGVESISPVGDAELEALGVDEATRKDAHHVKASAALEGMELFDASFFGYTPREAELMDPQHRVFLECCWEALERAGHAPGSLKGAVGVFAGASTNTYLLYNLVPNLERLGALDQVQIDVGNGGDFLSTRVAYKLDLRGPSYTVLSACSTSLVATHVACQSLLNEECDLALAGGVSIHVKHPEGYHYLPGGIVSPDGHCRAFDAKAEGTVFGSGVGVVVLKRLADALEDGDTILAVVRGSAINNDGSVKVGYTAPGVEGQAAVISEALGVAGVEPESIGYVETHGTGTKMGDPIEVRALTRALKPRPGAAGWRCALGSLKSNIGHLANAAGVSSLMKAALALKHRRIPPSLHVEQPNPECGFEGTPFYVNTTLTDWPAPPRGPRRAGVSSFGVGGTNAHVILEEPPPEAPSGPSRPVQLLVLSAKTPEALEAATDNLARHLRARPEQPLADVAWTLQVGRQAMAHRRVVVCGDREEALRALETREPRLVRTDAPSVQERPVAFLFPGQGSQYVDMARGLYDSEPVFREHLDTCATLLQPHLGLDLRTLLYPADPAGAEEAARKLAQTALTQPALFAVEYALAKLWMSWGVKPQAMLGHSIGEYVAACLAGVFELRDALALVAARGQLMQALPAGAMLSVMLPEEELRPHLGAELSVAAINGPSLTVVAGPTPRVEALEASLKERGVGVQRLHTSHAFHSSMMDPLLAPFTERVRQVKRNPPKLPFISNVTGTWIDAAQATDPAYWARHLREAVRFSEGLQLLAQKPQQALLEVGPGTTLGTLTRGQPGMRDRVVLSSTRHPREQASDEAVLLDTLGRLWLSGVNVRWTKFSAHEQRRRLPLPTYPFERQRYWLEAPRGGSAPRPVASASAGKKADLADWFQVPSWKRAPLPTRTTEAGESGARWLLFADGHGLADALAPRLARGGRSVVRVVPGEAFGRREDGAYTVNPRRSEDYTALLQALEASGQKFDRIAHLWSVAPGPVSLEQALDTGFHSLVFLAQALGAQGRTEPLRCQVVSNDIYKVERTDVVRPEKATVLGPCRVVPQELPHLTCHFVDVALDAAGAVEGLAAELEARAPEAVVARRGRLRWVQTFEPLRLEAGAEPVRELREGGVYLVTGGLAGLGYVLARELARRLRARLVLVEGADFPARAGWAQWLATHGPEDDTRRRIENAQALEASGAEVLVLGAEPTDEEQVRRVLAQAEERFGRVHGVLHAAGSLHGTTFQTVQETSLEASTRHLVPQARALRVLEKVLAGRELDFCLLVSSLSSVLGGVGQVAQAAAGQLMDALAEQHGDEGALPWLSVGWDAWRLEESAALTALSPALAQYAILPEEGLEATWRILTQAEGGPLAVSTGDLEARRRQAASTHAAASSSQKEAAPASHPRPALATAYVAPRSELERTLVQVCQEVLGIEPVGVDDNFFELGGNSLIAVQTSAQLKRVLQADVPAATLYQRPTVRALAELLGQSGDAANQQRADKLAQRKEELSRRNQWLHRRRR
ncbi:MAG TPA: beta-ketoacyl synthase N-terminal-like domain-containing protein, partial [Myxococcaceae bacterium]|nr:beta-ketoacyl synthase N-terminal-like domain-containing protein [Myxococcaceae bacterium]